MVRTSVLHDALNAINNAEKAGKRQVMIRPSSKVIIKFLQVMQRHGMYPIFLVLSLLFASPFPSPVCTLFGMITRATVDTAPRLSPYKLPIDLNSEILQRVLNFITHEVLRFSLSKHF